MIAEKEWTGMNSNSEEWRAIPRFEGLYEVSNLGRVRSLDREVIKIGRWGKPVRFLLKGKMRKTPLAEGYPHVNLSGGRGLAQHVSVAVHAIVAEVFIGPRQKGMDVRHRDGDRSNASVDNLEYGTRTQNAQDAFRHGTRGVGEKAPNSKATTQQMLMFKSCVLAGATCKSAAMLAGISYGSGVAANGGKAWSWLVPSNDDVDSARKRLIKEGLV